MIKYIKNDPLEKKRHKAHFVTCEFIISHDTITSVGGWCARLSPPPLKVSLPSAGALRENVTRIFPLFPLSITNLLVSGRFSPHQANHQVKPRVTKLLLGMKNFLYGESVTDS